jgi:hypothetical protein
LHAAQHHYFSLLSAGILATVLALAMTSASFEVEGGDQGEPPAAQATGRPSATPGVIRAAATPVPGPRDVVYYFVGSQTQRDEMAMALHADIAGSGMRGSSALSATARVFIVVEDYRDEAEALEFLRQLVGIPPANGTTIRVVDLR